MNFAIDEIKSVDCLHLETGEKFKISDTTIEIDTLSSNEVPEIRTFGVCEASFTCENAVINENLLSKLFLPKKSNTFDIQYTIMAQARKHKKKRINKKWLKRYVRKPMKITSKGWKLSEYNTRTGECELIK